MLNAHAELERANQVPAPELERRIVALIGLYKSRTEAAMVAGMSTDQLARYEKGSPPAFAPLAKLAIAKGVRLEWLATGQGDMRREPPDAAQDKASQQMRLDPEMLASAISAVDAGLGVLDVEMPGDAKTKLVLVVYRRLIERVLSPAEVVAAVLQSIKQAKNRE